MPKTFGRDKKKKKKRVTERVEVGYLLSFDVDRTDLDLKVFLNLIAMRIVTELFGLYQSISSKAFDEYFLLI